MEIPIFKKKMKIGIFFSNLGKKAPIFHLEWGRILAPENTKKSLMPHPKPGHAPRPYNIPISHLRTDITLLRYQDIAYWLLYIGYDILVLNIEKPAYAASIEIFYFLE